MASSPLRYFQFKRLSTFTCIVLAASTGLLASWLLPFTPFPILLNDLSKMLYLCVTLLMVLFCLQDKKFFNMPYCLQYLLPQDLFLFHVSEQNKTLQLCTGIEKRSSYKPIDIVHTKTKYKLPILSRNIICFLFNELIFQGISQQEQFSWYVS